MSSDFEQLRVLVQRIDQVAKATQQDFKGRFSVLEASALDFDSDSDESDRSLDAFEDLLEDMNAYIESLIDLSPSISKPAVDHFILEDTGAVVEILTGVSEPARPFVLALRDRFPSLNTIVVRRLGEANWKRRKSLQDKLSLAISVQRDVVGDDNATISEGTVRPHDRRISQIYTSTIRSSISLPSTYPSVTTRTDFSEHSIFDQNSIIIPSKSRYSVAESVTSYSSSLAEGTLYGQRRLPNLPGDHDFELPFQCQICGDTLTRIRHRADWK